MARPKGVIQKRDESKYWLPLGIVLLPGQTQNYNKETPLIFIDTELGEFQSYFKALQIANASTHPLAVQKRRETTNIQRFGGTNPSHSKEIRKKAQNTMLEKYGVEHALLNPNFLKKSKETLKSNYNIDNPMHSEEIKQTLKRNNIVNFGFENVMQVESIKNDLKLQFIEKYGVDNPAKHPPFQEKALKTMIQNNNVLSSKGELEIRDFIREQGLDAKSGYIGGANPKQIDIKISEIGIGIEYNGTFWHCEGNKSIYPNYHKDKMLAAKEQGLKLIQIFDFEWNDRKEQVKSFLKSAVGKNQIKVFARNTEVIELTNKIEVKEFLEKYHILGSIPFNKAYGLKWDNELLCLITINKHHRNGQEWVLNRYVGKYDVNVIGGLSKLVSRAVKDFGTLTTWIDLRFSDGEKWVKSGWEVISILPPDYFYYNPKNGKIIPKQSRKKTVVGTPEYVTEREHAKLDGLKRVYDCGKIKLRFKK